MKKTISIFIVLACHTVFAGRFLIPVLPDTQCEVDANTNMFYSQMNQ